MANHVWTIGRNLFYTFTSVLSFSNHYTHKKIKGPLLLLFMAKASSMLDTPLAVQPIMFRRLSEMSFKQFVLHALNGGFGDLWGFSSQGAIFNFHNPICCNDILYSSQGIKLPPIQLISMYKMFWNKMFWTLRIYARNIKKQFSGI